MCLPFCFNPFTLLFGLLPFLYLISWPVIIQLFGQDLLRCHSLIFIIFTLCNDICRNLMLQTVGFDILSRPVALALIVGLFSQNGKTFLSYTQPFYNSVLSMAQPIFLAIEVVTFVGITYMLGSFIGNRFSIFKLKSGSIYYKILNVLLTMICFVSSYMIINEALHLIKLNGAPVDFVQAIEVTILLQVLSIIVAIYYDKGVFKHSALMAVMACVPIYLEAWSYNYQFKKQMEETSLLNRLSSWLSSAKAWLPGLQESSNRINVAPYHSQYLFGGGLGGPSMMHGGSLENGYSNSDSSFNMMVDNNNDYATPSTTTTTTTGAMGQNSIFSSGSEPEVAYDGSSGLGNLKRFFQAIQLLLTGLTGEIMQIFWHTFTKCQGCDGLCVRWPWARQSYCLRWAQFYLGSHFWGMLALRVGCCLSTGSLWKATTTTPTPTATTASKSMRVLPKLIATLVSLVPLTRWSVIKVLFVLIYTQMLIDHVAASSSFGPSPSSPLTAVVDN